MDTLGHQRPRQENQMCIHTAVHPLLFFGYCFLFFPLAQPHSVLNFYFLFKIFFKQNYNNFNNKSQEVVQKEDLHIKFLKVFTDAERPVRFFDITVKLICIRDDD